MSSALQPATLEGWYVLHQVLELDRPGGSAGPSAARAAAAEAARQWFDAHADLGREGWSAAFRLIGAGADLLLIHFRSSLDELGRAESAMKHSPLSALSRSVYDFLSVTEAGLYHATAKAAAEHGAGTEAFDAALAERAAAELASPHVQKRLFPTIPEGMRYLSFYPMNKRRVDPDNWYLLPIDERSRLMRDHGLTGRRYSGRVFQVISGSVGLDDWEWGVTLFARDPLEFKKLVTEMRFDEVSARYGEFGRFFTGVRLAPEEWAGFLAAE